METELPTSIEEVDSLRVRLALAEASLSRALAEAATAAAQQAQAALWAKYKLGPKDTIDTSTLQITRVGA